MNHHLGRKVRSIGKPDSWFNVLVVRIDRGHRRGRKREARIPEWMRACLLRHGLLVQEVRGLSEVLIAQTEIERQVAHCLPVILKVECIILFLERNVWVSLCQRDFANAFQHPGKTVGITGIGKIAQWNCLSRIGP